MLRYYFGIRSCLFGLGMGRLVCHNVADVGRTAAGWGGGGVLWECVDGGWGTLSVCDFARNR